GQVEDPDLGVDVFGPAAPGDVVDPVIIREERLGDAVDEVLGAGDQLGAVGDEAEAGLDDPDGTAMEVGGQPSSGSSLPAPWRRGTRSARCATTQRHSPRSARLVSRARAACPLALDGRLSTAPGPTSGALTGSPWRKRRRSAPRPPHRIDQTRCGAEKRRS